MKQYLDLLEDIKTNGTIKTDRTGTGTKSVFGRQLRFDLSQGFPAVTTKKLFLRGIIHELLWFINGDSNIEYLVKNDVHIWDEWPYRAYLQAEGKSIPEVGSDEWKTGLAEFTDRIKNDHEFAVKYGELGPILAISGAIGQMARVVRLIRFNKRSTPSRPTPIHVALSYLHGTWPISRRWPRQVFHRAIAYSNFMS